MNAKITVVFIERFDGGNVRGCFNNFVHPFNASDYFIPTEQRYRVSFFLGSHQARKLQEFLHFNKSKRHLVQQYFTKISTFLVRWKPVDLCASRSPHQYAHRLPSIVQVLSPVSERSRDRSVRYQNCNQITSPRVNFKIWNKTHPRPRPVMLFELHTWPRSYLKYR